MKKAVIFAAVAGVLAGSSVARAQSAAAPASPAPAATQQALPAWLQYHSPYAGKESDIANPHRTIGEIEIWAEQTAADVLSFNKRNYTPKMTGFQKYFTPSGWKQYADYLQSSRIVDMVGTDNYSVGTIVDERPLVINQGDVNGAYNWILRMPVTISFFTKDPVTGTEKTGPSAKFYLFMDVARVASGGGENGIAIADWRMENNTSTQN